MASERLRQVEDIFEEVLDLPQDQWASFLDAACGGDRWVREEVESLLSHHGDLSVDFLTPSSDRVGVHSVDANRQIGRTIGRYLIKQVLGSGGMGTVYLAEEQRLSRDVAIKILNLAWRHHPARHRFEWEARLLAQLHHPHIAQVFEAGTHEDGHESVPYFAMEYIPHAVSIIDYAKREQLGLRKKLELFLAVCDAVHHGHQKGIVHRDLKPGNLLVDQEGHIKVIDFGIARITDSDIAATTIVTDTGQIIGTLQYMSPEQIDGAPEALDIRSDIYSLGVVLYELVCEELPYDVRGATLTNAARRIREDEIPAPRNISRNLKGDLETIILAAMERSRVRRYQSASELAADIRRYLSREPIMAKPATAWIRLTRKIARHPLAATVILCLAVGTALPSSVFITIWTYDRQPAKLELTENRIVRLMAYSGNLLHRWSVQSPARINVAMFLERDPYFGGGQIAILGYQNDRTQVAANRLDCYDVLDDPQVAVWSDELTTSDLPVTLLRRGIVAEDFCPVVLAASDIFAEVPGKEIIVNWRCIHSAGAIRVLDQHGTPLFQFWHEGAISDSYFLDGPGLLVFAGINAEVYWRNRGFPELTYTYPRVLFGIRPERGLVARDFIHEIDSSIANRVAWYRCVLPPAAASELNWSGLFAPPERLDPAYFVSCDLYAPNMPGDPGLTLVVDANGQLVPEGMVVSDAYELTIGLPDPKVIHLGDIPPIFDPDGVYEDSNNPVPPNP